MRSISPFATASDQRGTSQNDIFRVTAGPVWSEVVLAQAIVRFHDSLSQDGCRSVANGFEGNAMGSRSSFCFQWDIQFSERLGVILHSESVRCCG